MPHWWRPLPVGIGEASFRMRVTGDPDQMVCTMGFDYDTPPTAGTADSLFTAFKTYIGPRLSSTVTMEGVHIIYQQDSVLQTAADSIGATAAGTRATSGSTFPMNSAYLVRKRTAFAGKRNRGRWYLPGVVETDSDNLGVLGASDITAWNTALGNFFTSIDAHHPVIIHSVFCENGDQGHTGVHSATPQPATPVVSLEIDDHIATQRRRLNR